MRARTGRGLGGHALLLLAVCGLAAVLAPASCTLDVQGTAPDTPGTGGTGGMGPGVGGMGPGVGGSTTTSNGGGGQGGTVAPPPEDCLDGADNDMDGLVDCADVDDCAPAEYECAPEAPAGWTGHVRAVTVPAGDTLPECPTGMTATDLYADPADAACTTCECAWSSVGAACSSPAGTCWWGSTNCQGGTAELFTAKTMNACQDSLIPNFTGSCRITTPPAVLNQGSCTIAPTGGQIQDPVPFGGAVRICAGDGTTGGGCTAGSVCVPRAGSGTPALDEMVCITRDGTDACPTGWTDIDTQAYASGDDQRACAACTCDLTVTCNGGGMRAHSRDACDVNNGSMMDLSSNCSNVLDYGNSDTFSIFATLATPSGQATCAGGEPSGSVVTTGETKLCCHQQQPPPPPP